MTCMKLYTNLVESGYAQLQIDGDWLEIELNSGLLFPSGSSSPTNAAKDILSVIYEVVAEFDELYPGEGLY